MEKKKNNPLISYIVALAMGVYFFYKGIRYVSIGHGMNVSGILLIICAIVLFVGSIIMICKNYKKNSK